MCHCTIWNIGEDSQTVSGVTWFLGLMVCFINWESRAFRRYTICWRGEIGAIREDRGQAAFPYRRTTDVFGPASRRSLVTRGGSKANCSEESIGTSQRGSCRLFQNMGYIVRGGRREASRLVAPKTPVDWRGKGQYRRLPLWSLSRT